MTFGRVLRFACMALLFWGGSAGARDIVDMAGRRVTVPGTIRTVYGASPPATYMVYAVDPGLVAGLNFPFNPAEKKFLAPRMADLPVIGGWFGQGRAANPETLLAVNPDIVLVWQWQGRQSAVNDKIEQAVKPLGLPVVYMVLDDLADYPAVFRFLGKLFQQEARAEALAEYAETALETAARVRTAIPAGQRVSVYYAEGSDGLSTECGTSVHAQLIPLSGGKNVHRCFDAGGYGMKKISMEQVLLYDPQVIISHDPLFFSTAAKSPRWQNIRAVQDGRVYRIPRHPFNWFDRPPSFMRLLGVQWLMHRLYPEHHPIDLAAETRAFYHLFLRVDLNEAAVTELLQP